MYFSFHFFFLPHICLKHFNFISCSNIHIYIKICIYVNIYWVLFIILNVTCLKTHFTEHHYAKKSFHQRITFTYESDFFKILCNSRITQVGFIVVNSICLFMIKRYQRIKLIKKVMSFYLILSYHHLILYLKYIVMRLCIFLHKAL